MPAQIESETLLGCGKQCLGLRPTVAIMHAYGLACRQHAGTCHNVWQGVSPALLLLHNNISNVDASERAQVSWAIHCTSLTALLLALILPYDPL